MAKPPDRPKSLDEAAGLVEPGAGTPLSDSSIGSVQRGERFTDPGQPPPEFVEPVPPPAFFRLPINGSHVIPISNTPSEPGFDEALGMGLAYEIQDDTLNGNPHRDPNGNVTKWGVDQTKHPSVDVANLTREGAVEFYKGHPLFWPTAKNVPNSHRELRAVYMEGLINAGSNATRALQMAFGLINEQVDGGWGPITRAAMAIALRAKSEEALIRDYFSGREARYNWLAAVNPARNGKNLGGWLNRIKDTSAWYYAVIKLRRTRL
jgi:hypothetical protein